MEMEETLIDKNEDVIFKNGLFELKEQIIGSTFKFFFHLHSVKLFWFGIMFILSYGVKFGFFFFVIDLGAMEQWRLVF